MDNFSHLMMLGECLLDKKRTELFEKAIQEIVTPTDLVLDGGTGSGIMAMLAARAGAKKVYAVDIDKETADLARENIKHNGFQDKIDVLHGDLKELKVPKVDVLVMEMMHTGLIEEQQVPAINNLIDIGVVDETTKMIPFRCDTYITFVNYDFNFYGFNMPFIVDARNFGVMDRVKEVYTNKILVNSNTFGKRIDLNVNTDIQINPLQTGTANAFILDMETFLSPSIKTWGTTDMNMPVIFPIKELMFTKGTTINANISYKLSHGFNTVNLDIQP